MGLQANTIEHVIDNMNEIIQHSVNVPSRLGFFASLYRTVTIVVKHHCDADDLFEDNDRMRHLDVIFANRYFEALEAHLTGGAPTQSWQVAFDAAGDRDYIILQHLLMGMNAHISLDLGIAAAVIGNGELNDSLQRDFNRLNNLLAGLVNIVQMEIEAVSPVLRVLDMMALSFDERVIGFAIDYARDRAWNYAEVMTPLIASRADWDAAIIERDKAVGAFAKRTIANKLFPNSMFMWLVNLMESKDIGLIIDKLTREEWHRRIERKLDTMIEKAQAQGIDLAQNKVKFRRGKLNKLLE